MHRVSAPYALHLEGFLWQLPFIGIEGATIEDWIEEQLDIDAAPKSVRNRRGLLSSIMKQGRRMKLRVEWCKTHDAGCCVRRVRATSGSDPVP